jgi:hypothetical protein
VLGDSWSLRPAKVCLCLERGLTYEVFREDAQSAQQHQISLLNWKEEEELDQFLKPHGMDVKLFKTMKDSGNKTAHVERPPSSVKEIEAMVHKDSDRAETD